MPLVLLHRNWRNLNDIGFLNLYSATPGTRTRLETVNQNFDVRSAYAYVTNFYQPSDSCLNATGDSPSREQLNDTRLGASGDHLQHIMELPDMVL